MVTRNKPQKKASWLIVLWLCFFPFMAEAQLANIWRFGNGAGLDFSSPIPTPLAMSGFNALEGTSSACDFNGNLLFYTNGNEARTAINTIMPNGSGLLGGTSTTQTAIVPWPGQCAKYFIIQASDHTQTTGQLSYSVVDMCLNNGLGDVVVGSKNIFIQNSISEKVCVVTHSNGIDFWVITHELGSAVFRVYPITAAGIGASINTTIGSVHASNCMIGPIKASPNGQKIVVEKTFCSTVELFDFNNTTGIVSNVNNISAQLPSAGNGYYGAEFSPNGQFLYLACTWVTSRIIQYDLNTTNQTLLSSVAGNYVYGGMQLGPDGKIYIAHNNQNALDVIANPNIAGFGSNFTPAGQALAVGTTSTMGISCFIPSYLTQIAVPPILTVNIGNDTTINCNAAFSIQLDAGSFCSAQYLWQNGATSQTITVTQPGTYYVEVNAVCGIGTDTITITTNSIPPVVQLTGPTTICAGQSITLTAGGASSYNWLSGQGFTMTYPDSAIASPVSTTTYTVIGTDACGTDTAYFTVNVTPASNITALSDTTICSGASVTLSASGSTNYQWSGGSNSTQQTITVSPTQTTVYYASSTDLCPGTPDTITVTVLPAIAVSLTGPTNICSGQSITLLASGSGSFSWPAGQGFTSTYADSAIANPTATSTYSVISTGACGADTASVTVNVSPVSNVTALSDTTICSGASVTLSASGSTNYQWSGGSNSTQQTITVSPTQTTVYYASSTDLCPGTPDTITVTVLPAIAVSLTGPTNICSGQSITLLASGSGSFSWPAGQGFTSTYADSAIANPTATSTYSVISTGACGADTASVTVNVSPVSNVTALSDTTICSGASVTLSASGSTNYQWSGGSNSTQQTITVSPTQTTVYYASSTDLCPGTADTITVTVASPVSVSLSGPPIVCLGDLVTLTASGNSNLTWLNGVNATGNTAIVMPAADSTFYVIADGGGFCPDDTAAFSLNITSAYQPAFSYQQFPCSKELVFLNQSNGGAAFEWNFGDGQSSSSTQTTHAYDHSGTYTVTLVVNPNLTCSDSIEMVVNYEASEISDVWIPNAFTPNDDTRNEVFQVYGYVECYYEHMQIFNRWGELIWETDSPSTVFWDGRVNDNIVPEGVYVYKLSGQNLISKIGSVTVIR
jgi:trimeric autotransporter adhesin